MVHTKSFTVMKEIIHTDFLENSMPLAFFCLLPFPMFTPGFTCPLKKDMVWIHPPEDFLMCPFTRCSSVTLHPFLLKPGKEVSESVLLRLSTSLGWRRNTHSISRNCCYLAFLSLWDKLVYFVLFASGRLLIMGIWRAFRTDTLPQMPCRDQSPVRTEDA